MEHIRIIFNPQRRPLEFPESVTLNMSPETLAGILVGQELVEGDDFQSFLEAVERLNSTTGEWEPVSYSEFLDPHELFSLRDSPGFTFNPNMSRWRAWEEFLANHNSLDMLDSRYTLQARHVEPPDSYEYYQFDTAEFLRGIITILTWAGVNWRDYLGPIFQFIRREIEII
jgi:hypothetical protein